MNEQQTKNVLKVYDHHAKEISDVSCKLLPIDFQKIINEEATKGRRHAQDRISWIQGKVSKANRMGFYPSTLNTQHLYVALWSFAYFLYVMEKSIPLWIKIGIIWGTYHYKTIRVAFGQEHKMIKITDETELRLCFGNALDTQRINNIEKLLILMNDVSDLKQFPRRSCAIAASYIDFMEKNKKKHAKSNKNKNKTKPKKRSKCVKRKKRNKVNLDLCSESEDNDNNNLSNDIEEKENARDEIEDPYAAVWSKCAEMGMDMRSVSAILNKLLNENQGDRETDFEEIFYIIYEEMSK